MPMVQSRWPQSTGPVVGGLLWANTYTSLCVLCQCIVIGWYSVIVMT